MFGPFGPGFVEVPYGDLAALEAAITPNTCAFLAEPLQAEGGIIIPPDGYLAGVRQLCDKHNMLLIWDEVQTGFGRTGRKFGWQWEDAEPDLMAGLWDYASVEIFEVITSNLSAGVRRLRRGRIGEVSVGRTVYEAELRGL
jgi:hypothetical protein